MRAWETEQATTMLGIILVFANFIFSLSCKLKKLTKVLGHIQVFHPMLLHLLLSGPAQLDHPRSPMVVDFRFSLHVGRLPCFPVADGLVEGGRDPEHGPHVGKNLKKCIR